MLGTIACDLHSSQQQPPPQQQETPVGLAGSFPVANDTPSTHGRRRWYLASKFAIEWVLAVLLFVGSAPLLCILAVLVKTTSRGPAFYSQTRLGRGGRLYRIYKVRTMRQDAEVHSGPVWAAKDDARITSLGRLLRDTHLDELPQLWNVLKGDMALIGPRPERPEIAARITTRLPWFHQRLSVRPGVTGLAQMLLPADDPNDANYDCVRAKLTHDLLYIREISPFLDAKIALCTTCYFCGAAIDVLRRRLLRSYARMVEGRTIVPPLAAAAPELKQGVA